MMKYSVPILLAFLVPGIFFLSFAANYDLSAEYHPGRISHPASAIGPDSAFLLPEITLMKVSGINGASVRAIQPTGRGRLVVGTTNGIFYSSDNGQTWNRGELSGVDIFSICRTTTGILYCGTLMRGIFQSMDNGVSWHSVNTGLPPGGANFVVSLGSDSSGNIYAGTYGGVYHSSDMGQSWTQRSAGVADSVVESMFVTRSQDIFISTMADPSGSRRLTHHVYRSTDQARTWEAVSISEYSGVFRFAEDDRGVLYAAGGTLGLYYSTDGGTEWRQFRDPGIIASRIISTNRGVVIIGEDAETYGVYLLDPEFILKHLAVAPNGEFVHGLWAGDDGSIFAGTGGGVWMSDDLVNWRLRAEGMEHPPIRDITFSADGRRCYVATSAGIFRSDDSGRTFAALPDRERAAGVHTVRANRDDDVVAVSTLGGLIRLNRDEGIWEKTLDTFAVRRNVSLAVSPGGNFYLGSVDGILFRSSDGGRSWIRILSDTNKRIYSIFVDSLEVIYLGSKGAILRSPDGGKNWSGTGGGMPEEIVVSMARGMNGELYAGLAGAGLYRSNDTGKSWERVHRQFDGLTVYKVSVNRSGHIFLRAQNNSALLRSTDNGSLWMDIPLLQGRATVDVFGLDPDGYLFVGSGSQGLFRSGRTTNRVIPEAGGR